MRIIDQSSGYGHTLPLSARQLIGLMIGPVAQSDGLKIMTGPLQPLSASHAGINQRQSDVFQCGNTRKQIEILKDKPYLFIARSGQFIITESGYLLAVQLIRAFRRAIQTAEDIHQRRFARAGRPHQRGKLPPVDIGRNAIERRQRLAADMIKLPNSGKLYGSIPFFVLFHDGSLSFCLYIGGPPGPPMFLDFEEEVDFAVYVLTICSPSDSPSRISTYSSL